MGITVKNAALAEHNGEIVIRGEIPVAELGKLKVDRSYQREYLYMGKKNSNLMTAVSKEIRFPAVDLNMRGQRVIGSDGNYELLDEVFIVDGQQRTFSMLDYAKRNPNVNGLALGVEIHMGVTNDPDANRAIERKRFEDLNKYRRPVAPSVHLRGAKDNNPAIATVFGLSTSDASSPLFKRVTWAQMRAKGEVVSAATIVHALVDLFVIGGESSDAGVARRSRGDSAERLNHAAHKMGLAKYRQSVRELFEVLDEAFGIRNLDPSTIKVPYLSRVFLSTIVRILRGNKQFWKNGTLSINKDFRKRLGSFKLMTDPHIKALASSGSTNAIPILHGIMLKHLNTRRKAENKLV